MTAIDARVVGPAVARPSFRSALRAREFRWLMVAYSLQAIGQTFGTVAITVAIFEQTGSATWVAFAAAARLVPYVLLSGLAGVLADRIPRKTLLALSISARATLAILLGVALAATAPPLLIVVLAFCFTACGTPCYPCLAAAIPTVVPEQELAPANAILTGLETLAFIAGPAAGAAALVLGSPATAMFVNALIFGVALAPIAKLRDRGECTTTDDSQVDDAQDRGSPLTAGIRAITSSGEVAAPLLLVVAVNLVYGGSLVGLVLVADELLGTGRSGFAALNAALGVGAFIGVLLTSWLARSQRPLPLIACTTLLAGVPVALLALVDMPQVAAALMLASGVGSVLTEVLALTMLQRATPRRVIASVFGILDSLMVCAILLGSLIAPTLIDFIGLRASLVLVGAVVPMTAIVLAGWLHRAARRAAQRSALLEPDVVLLAGLPWLTGALRPTLEALAATATTERVAAGVRIVEQGRTPDDFFVLVSGALDVVRWGRPGEPERHVARLEPGAGFGEIGLLHRVARTASVVATEPSVVMRITGRFVAAVSGVPQSAGAAPAGGLVARLGGKAATQ